MTERMHTNFACTHCGKVIDGETAYWNQGLFCRACWEDLVDRTSDYDLPPEQEAEHD